MAYCRQCNKLLQAMQHARRGGDTGKRGNARFNAHTHQCPYTHAHARTHTYRSRSLQRGGTAAAGVAPPPNLPVCLALAYTIAYWPCAPRPTDPVPRGQLWPVVSVYVCMYI